jgi:hypothetical protein
MLASGSACHLRSHSLPSHSLAGMLSEGEAAEQDEADMLEACSLSPVFDARWVRGTAMNSDDDAARASRSDGRLEADLVHWSWAVGGWAGIHAGLAAAALLMGAQPGVNTLPLRIAACVTVAAWATAAIAAWRFRGVCQLKTGLIAASASFIAGATLPFVGDASAGALVELRSGECIERSERIAVRRTVRGARR